MHPQRSGWSAAARWHFRIKTAFHGLNTFSCLFLPFWSFFVGFKERRLVIRRQPRDGCRLAPLPKSVKNAEVLGVVDVILEEKLQRNE